MKYLILFSCFLFLVHCQQNVSRSRVNPVQHRNHDNPDDSNREEQQNRRWSGSLTISNTEVYHHLLQAHGICETLTWSLGNAKCKKWDSTAYVELIFKKDSLPSSVDLKITPQLETVSNPYFRPSQIIAVTGDADHTGDYGFQARLSQHLARSGPVGGSFVIVKSESGTPVERLLSVDIFYGGRAHEDVKIGTLSLENPSKPVSTSDTQITPGR